MYVVCVDVEVKPEHIDDFIAATQRNHEGTRGEPGNVRFDLLQSSENRAVFFLHEVYHREEDFHDHHQTAHYLEWRDRVEGWMARPRQAAKYVSLLPTDELYVGSGQ